MQFTERLVGLIRNALHEMALEGPQSVPHEVFKQLAVDWLHEFIDDAYAKKCWKMADRDDRTTLIEQASKPLVNQEI